MRNVKDKTALGGDGRSRLVQVAQMLLTHPADGIKMIEADPALPADVRAALSETFGSMDAVRALERLRMHESAAVRETAGVLDWVRRSKMDRDRRFAPVASKRAVGID